MARMNDYFAKYSTWHAHHLNVILREKEKRDVDESAHHIFDKAIRAIPVYGH